MKTPELSIFLGGIRPFLWERLYNSITDSIGDNTFELVVCGPTKPPSSFDSVLNFKYIRDFGGPARGAQLAALFSEGKYITLGADDGQYLPGALAKALDFHREGKADVTAVKYMEGGNNLPDNYFRMVSWNHFRMPGVPDDAPMMLNSIMSRELFYEVGGYDCATFQTCNWGGQDLTLRLLKQGKSIRMFKEHILSCDHDNQQKPNGFYDDHHPIYLADDMGVSGSDYHKFRALYSTVNERARVDFDNWKQSESVWNLRFGSK
jgi:hypothetical protein